MLRRVSRHLIESVEGIAVLAQTLYDRFIVWEVVAVHICKWRSMGCPRL